MAIVEKISFSPDKGNDIGGNSALTEGEGLV